jgi:hypothetical protein
MISTSARGSIPAVAGRRTCIVNASESFGAVKLIPNCPGWDVLEIVARTTASEAVRTLTFSPAAAL